MTKEEILAKVQAQQAQMSEEERARRDKLDVETQMEAINNGDAQMTDELAARMKQYGYDPTAYGYVDTSYGSNVPSVGGGVVYVLVAA